MAKPYYFSKVVDPPFAPAVAATVEALGRHGFGVLTDIDVQVTLKKKLDLSFRVDPVASMQAVENPALADTAMRVSEMGYMVPFLSSGCSASSSRSFPAAGLSCRPRPYRILGACNPGTAHKA